MWPFISVPGLVSIGVGFVLSMWSKVHDKEELALKRAGKLTSLEELDGHKVSLPALVAVSGRAISDVPLQCKLSTGKAVIRELTEEEIVWKATWRDPPGKEFVVLKQEREEAEWYLVDDTPQRLRIQGGPNARLLPAVMQQRQVFKRDQGGGRWRGVLEHLMCNTFGMRCTILVGTRDTERHLPVGAVVTVVGQLADANGSKQPALSWWRWGGEEDPKGKKKGTHSHKTPHDTPHNTTSQPTSSRPPVPSLVLRKPVEGGPFYITNMTLPELQAALTQSATLLQNVSRGMMLVGAFLLLRKMLQHFNRWHQQRRWLQEMRTVSWQQPPGGSSRRSSQQQQQLDEEASHKLLGTCIVCMEEQVGCVYEACGHLCCCTTCAQDLSSCPICRTASNTIRVFAP